MRTVAHISFAHVAQGEHELFQKSRGQSVEKIGLVLALVQGFFEHISSVAFIPADTCVVAGGEAIEGDAGCARFFD